LTVEGRKLDLALSLLDRQIVDKDGQPTGNVDDLELECPQGGGGAPFVRNLLVGPGALSQRLGGSLGKSIWLLHRRLNHGNPDPVRISMSVVKRIGVKVELIIAASDVEGWKLQQWIRDHVILKIPGAGHAPE
jgi:sporulation protein YlmC with PRC-barrel domain